MIICILDLSFSIMCLKGFVFYAPEYGFGNSLPYVYVGLNLRRTFLIMFSCSEVILLSGEMVVSSEAEYQRMVFSPSALSFLLRQKYQGLYTKQQTPVTCQNEAIKNRRRSNKINNSALSINRIPIISKIENKISKLALNHFWSAFRPALQKYFNPIPSKSSAKMSTFCEKISEDKNFTVEPKQGMRFTLHNIALDLNSHEAALFLLNDSKQILIAQLSRNVGGIKSINLFLEFGEGEKVRLVSKGGVIHLIGGFKYDFKASIASTRHESEESNQQSTPEPRKRQSRSLRHRQKPEQSQSKKIRKQQKRKALQQKQQEEEQQQEVKPQPSEHDIDSQEVLAPRRSTRSRAPPKPTKIMSEKSKKKQKQFLNNMGNYFGCKIDDDDDEDDDDESFGEGDPEAQEDGEDEEEDDDQDDDEDFKANKKQEEAEEEEYQFKKRQPRKIRSRSQRPSEIKKLEQKQQIAQKISSSQQKKESNDLKDSSDSQFSIPKRNPYTP